MTTIPSKEDKIAYVNKMDELVREMNDETAVMWWLEEGVPDHIGEIDEDDLEYFVEDENYNELVGLFLAIDATYSKEKIAEQLKQFAYERRNKMKLTYKEWGNYIACRTHTLDEDELRKYLEDNFVDVDISEVTNERIKDIIFGEGFGTIIHTADKESYFLSDVIKDWVCDNLYEDDYKWEIYETDVCDDEIVAIED